MNSEFQFERYLDGAMQADELKAFETLLARNPDLAKAFEEYQKMDRFLREQHARYLYSINSSASLPGNAEIEDELSDYSEAMDKQSKQEKELRELLNRVMDAENPSEKAIFSFRKLAKIAAIFLVLVGISSVLYISIRPGSPHAIFQKYYAPYPAVTYTRGDNSLVSDTLELAMKAYREKDYRRASELFCMSDNQTNDPLQSIYLGICYLETNNEQLALASFSNILKYPESRFYIQALWYSGLTCLKFNHGEQAKVFLQEIPPELFDYSRKAGTILKKL